MKLAYLMLSYLFGSIPSGYLVVWFRERQDIRQFGSQSTGATNVLRVKGLTYAIPVALMDLLKGFLPVFLALRLFDDERVALAAAFCAVVGHCYPIYIRFRGGKGVATAMGAYALLAFHPFLCSIGLFIIVVAASRYVSLGSLAAASSFPLFVLIFKEEKNLLVLGIAIFIVITVRHLGNISRLIRGKERKLGKRNAQGQESES